MVIFKSKHEIRDPIHNFIKVTSEERNIIDSNPFQRLRYIHQLALTYLVYPGATHKRFEHSLGVMELASRVYDVVTQKDNLKNIPVEIIPQIDDDEKIEYWRKVIRAAALCHDLGHIPFSHAAEEQLLPGDSDHETYTLKLISKLDPLWEDMTFPIRKEDIQKLAVGPEKYNGDNLNNWETILSEIITGDAFGVDRMDYLLRDSYHIGVAYGKFDHYRLIDTIRILPKTYEDSDEPALGIEAGGIHNAEALSLSRYSMFSQVYMHSVRRIYDKHLKDFMSSFYDGELVDSVENHQRMRDDKVLGDMFLSLQNLNDESAEAARRIVERDHFKLLYEIKPSDKNYNSLKPGETLYEAIKERFGDDNVKHDKYSQTDSGLEFPVLYKDETISSSINISDTIQNMPQVSIEFIFIKPELLVDAKEWLEDNKEDILMFQ